eukprot:1138348-Rhodomonas_salina.1
MDSGSGYLHWLRLFQSWPWSRSRVTCQSLSVGYMQVTLSDWQMEHASDSGKARCSRVTVTARLVFQVVRGGRAKSYDPLRHPGHCVTALG